MSPWHCFVVALTLALSISQSSALFNRYHVYVVNGLANGTLTAHCQSKDDDLGFHYIPVNGNFMWSFRTNFLSTTLYFCHLWWAKLDAAFEVFNKDPKLRKFCGYTDCIWKAQVDGIYLSYNQKKRFEKWYNWTKV
ncbi:hypothetical protein L1049_004732 [Liquidambar formosana]|uniref:S-protein homolog n=1 Tax=Liquidambar formosana TaxID=63359 RepID=A0AAP0RNZ1_LIQFO